MPTRRGTQKSITDDASDSISTSAWDWELPPLKSSLARSTDKDVNAEFSLPCPVGTLSTMEGIEYANRRYQKKKSLVETEPVASGRRASTSTRHEASLPTLTTSEAAAVLQETLPPRRMFTIQLGDRSFTFSGASLASDAPSYFTRFFGDPSRQNETPAKTLYIDRDPNTFEDIALHLRGYHVESRDGLHFVKLFADAQYFSLPKLTAQLFSSTIHVRVGNKDFHIPRELFSKPGDSPNYFTLGFSTFFVGPSDLHPGLAEGPRPAALVPPAIEGRSAQVFADLLHILKGYEVNVRDEKHRADLLRDARYFHLKGLEQKLIPHAITYNLARQRSEIVIKLEDIRKEGLSLFGDSQSVSSSPGAASSSVPVTLPAWVAYQRPYIDQQPYSLIFEIGPEESATLCISPSTDASARLGRLTFFGDTLAKMNALLGIIVDKSIAGSMPPPRRSSDSPSKGIPASSDVSLLIEHGIKVRMGSDADVMINGRRLDEQKSDVDAMNCMDIDNAELKGQPITTDRLPGQELVLSQSQWRIRVLPNNGVPSGGRLVVDVVLGAVKIKGFSHERARNAARNFLS